VINRSIPSKQKPYNHDSFPKISRAPTALLVSKKYSKLSVQAEKVNNFSIPSTHAEKKYRSFS
jgi:hypothetical protein